MPLTGRVGSRGPGGVAGVPLTARRGPYADPGRRGNVSVAPSRWSPANGSSTASRCAREHRRGAGWIRPGKTVLLQQIAKWCGAEVIVYVGCGERGNEMAEVVGDLAELEDPRTGGRLADRTVVIANTSNMPMMAREASIYTGVSVAEYYRDMGYHAVVIADSTSRWAEALREFGTRSGALPTEEGYPADLASAIAAFYARAGAVTTLGGSAGSVTVVGAVWPPGGDLTEPVTAHTQRFVRCVWSLDRDLAYARHYPAVSWSGSFLRATRRCLARRLACSPA